MGEVSVVVAVDAPASEDVTGHSSAPTVDTISELPATTRHITVQQVSKQVSR